MSGAAARLQALRLLALGALAVCVALGVETFAPDAGACPFAACRDVMHSSWGRPLGVPLPLLGLGVFTALLGASLAPWEWTGRLVRALAVAAGAGGLGLILVQAVLLRSFCPLCLTVDGLGMLLALLALAPGWPRVLPPLPRAARVLWGSLAATVVLGGAVLGGARWQPALPPRRAVPPQVRALWQPGKVNVVEVADFDCPHCRRMHGVLRDLLREQGERVHHTQLLVPRQQKGPERAAHRAFLCASKQGKGAALADVLFVAPNRSAESCAAVASALGLDMADYRACVADPATDRELDDDRAWAMQASPTGLPAIWVQDRFFTGEPAPALLRAALQQARPSAPERQPPESNPERDE